MRARIRVALVSLAMSAGGLAGCGSLDKQSDPTTEWLVLPDPPEAKITPGEETSEPSAQDGQLGAKTAAIPPEKKDKSGRKPQPQTVKGPKKPVAPARAAAAMQPQAPEPKSAPAQTEPATVDLGVPFDKLTATLQKCYDMYFLPVWGYPVKLYNTKVPKRTDWQFIYFDDADTAGALGYPRSTNISPVAMAKPIC